MIENIIVDWSGTVVDDLDAVLQATNFTLKELGRAPVSKEKFRREFVLPIEKFYDRFLPGIPLNQIEALYHRFFTQTRAETKLSPGAADFCAFASTNGRRLFVLSTVSEAHFESQAEQYGIRSSFTRVYVGVKDKTKTIHSLLRENDLDPDRTLLVGDTVHDMQAARSAGVIAAAVLIGFDPIEKLASSEPDLIVRDLPAIQRIFGTDIQTCSGEWIEIGDLEVKGRIGVQEQEREDPQRLLVTVRFQIGLSFAALSDQFDKTIDYTLVAAQVEKVVETTRAHLIEKLVSDIGNALMAHFPMQRLEIELRKFILPNARYVSAKSGWKRV